MIKPNAIIRSNRKTLSLTVNKTGELIVRAPKRLDMDHIISFIKQKEKWITEKQKMINNIALQNQNIITYQSLMIFGKAYPREDVAKLKKVELHNNKVYVPLSISEEKTISIITKFYKEVSTETVKNRVEYFSKLMQVDFNSCSLINSKNKWGTCDNQDNIKFNFRISMLPHKVIDYIVIHELAHLIEFNHSKQFYNIIKSIMSDYKSHKNELKNYSYLLQLLR